MKRLFLFAIMLAFISGIINTSAIELSLEAEAPEAGEGILVKGFEASGFDFQEANINTTLYLEDTFLEMEKLEAIHREILDSLSLKGERIAVENQEYYEPVERSRDEYKDSIFIHKRSDAGYNQITASAVGKEDEIIVVIGYSLLMEDVKESHFIIDIVKNKGYKDIVELNHQNKAILSKYGSEIESTIGLTGYRPGRLSEAGFQKAIRAMSSTMRAERVEEILEEAYYSTTMYTPFIPRKINYSDKAVNLQIASSYNEYDDKTYLWIATPLITNTY